MLGDQADFVSRLRRVLPPHWFADVAPVRDAVLAGLGSAWEAIYALIASIRLQTRLATATAGFIDSFAADFFGSGFPRKPGESDSAYAQRVKLELLRPRATRTALVTALLEMTGQPVRVFEPARPADTGGYNSGGLGYARGGAYGNLSLRYQCFVGIERPLGGGIASIAGYGTGGVLAYGNLALVTAETPDAELYAAAAAIMPSGYVCWMQIKP